MYAHPEDEDFGSWGFEEDIMAGLRLRLLTPAAQRVNPIVSVHTGLALLQRIPFSKTDSSEQIGGYLIGAALGAEVSGLTPVTRVELAFDWPSFRLHDDSLARAGEMSLEFSGTLPW